MEEQRPELIEQSDKPAGVLGDGALHPGKMNLQLVRRAINNEWPIPMSYRKALVKQMGNVIADSEEERNRIAAAKVLVAADSVNVRRIAVAGQLINGTQPAQTQVNVNVGVGIQTSDNWYNNDAHALSAERAAASSADPAGRESV